MTAATTAPDVIAALRTRYAPPQWYLLTEVANGTGYTGKARATYADAVAVNAYQTGKHGAEVHGIEVKVSRADLLHELADAGKAEEVRRYCDRWWLAVPAPAADIVHAGELPAGWGLLEASGGAVCTVVEAPLLDATPMTRSFAAALVRRASEERAAKEAAKAALLKAPLRAVAYCNGYHGNLFLACGHSATYPPGTQRPKSVRCLACADGLPIPVDMIVRWLGALGADDVRAVATAAADRASAMERNPWLYATP